MSADRSNRDAWTICVDGLRDNWVGEITPGEAVDIMFAALDEEGDTTVRRTPEAYAEAEVMAAMVFADLLPEPVDYAALTSNVLRAIEKMSHAA